MAFQVDPLVVEVQVYRTLYISHHIFLHIHRHTSLHKTREEQELVADKGDLSHRAFLQNVREKSIDDIKYSLKLNK
jgi:hypothetical protein